MAVCDRTARWQCGTAPHCGCVGPHCMEAVRDRSALWQWGAELRCGSVGLHCNVAVSDCTAVEQCGTALRRGSVGLNCTVAVGGQGRLTPGCWRLPVPRCAGAYRGGGRGGPHPRLWAPPCSLTCGGVLRWGAPHPGLLAPPLCRVLRGCTAVGGGGRLTPDCWRLPVPRVEGGGVSSPQDVGAPVATVGCARPPHPRLLVVPAWGQAGCGGWRVRAAGAGASVWWTRWRARGCVAGARVSSLTGGARCAAR